MKRWTVFVCLVVAWLLATAHVRAETAAEVFNQGKALLAKGELEGALSAYQAAAQADRSNAGYVQQFTLVRQALELRNRMKVEQDPQRWQYIAWALHEFFMEQEAHPAALAVSKEIHQRHGSGESAMTVAETALAMNDGKTAADVLASLDAQEKSVSSEALRGVALARLGKKAEASQIAGQLQVPEDAGVKTLFAAARVYAVAGQKDAAVKSLARVFESTPPSKLEAVKQQVQRAPEFAAIQASPEFAAVLKTESKIAESKCSGGSSCAGCPMRGNCSKGH